MRAERAKGSGSCAEVRGSVRGAGTGASIFLRDDEIMAERLRWMEEVGRMIAFGWEYGTHAHTHRSESKRRLKRNSKC